MNSLGWSRQDIIVIFSGYLYYTNRNDLGSRSVYAAGISRLQRLSETASLASNFSFNNERQTNRASHQESHTHQHFCLA